MNNREKGEDLIRTARRIVARDLRGAINEGDFSMAVRRAQEAVELCFKGALSILGVEYPKLQDVGKIFTQVVRTRGIAAEEDLLQKVVHISTRLAAERAPAFYGEKLYGKEEAEEAEQDAEFVLKAVLRLIGSAMQARRT
mgnify:CR=1 FL=1